MSRSWKCRPYQWLSWICSKQNMPEKIPFVTKVYQTQSKFIRDDPRPMDLMCDRHQSLVLQLLQCCKVQIKDVFGDCRHPWSNQSHSIVSRTAEHLYELPSSIYLQKKTLPGHVYHVEIYTSTANAYGWYSDTTRSPGRYFHIKFVGWKIGNSGCAHIDSDMSQWISTVLLLLAEG